MSEALEFLNSLFTVIASLTLILFGAAWVTLLPSLGLAWALGWLG